MVAEYAEALRSYGVTTVQADKYAGAWVVDAFLDGEPPAAGAACELRGDAVAERYACTLGSVLPREGGAALQLTIAAADVPWLGSARSLRVRVAPPGTPPDAVPGGKEGGSP